jgi:hypothetical protein
VKPPLEEFRSILESCGASCKPLAGALTDTRAAFQCIPSGIYGSNDDILRSSGRDLIVADERVRAVGQRERGSAFIVACAQDKELWLPLVECGLPVYSTGVVLLALLQHKLNLSDQAMQFSRPS